LHPTKPISCLSRSRWPKGHRNFKQVVYRILEPTSWRIWQSWSN
jgi:hypothetical protein